MAKVLVLFAHPALEKSRVHSKLIRSIRDVEGVRFRDLYEAYPDLDIDVRREQQLLLQHDIIIWQHPFYWYSAPAMIKQWIDLVLEHGWAYGTGGEALKGKKIMNAISCGGPQSVYSHEGRNRFTIREFLIPFEQTAVLCHMQYLPPFVIHGTHKLGGDDIEHYAHQYNQYIKALVSEQLNVGELESAAYGNDLLGQLIN